MSSDSAERYDVGRVAGHRGNSGEITVRVSEPPAGRWVELEAVWLSAGSRDDGTRYEVEASRAYKDRLVLKLKGVDDPNRAARMRGSSVSVPEAELPPLPEGEYFHGLLEGMEVVDAASGSVGRVERVVETAGADLLVVMDGDEETMIPLVDQIVEEVDREQRRIRVRLPEGLRELNRPGTSEG